jgi:GNAT superfamily N-acetyltransferase
MGRHELWVEVADRPGNLAAVAADLASCGANILHLDVHAGGESTVVDRLVVQVPDERSHELAAAAARCGATLLHLNDADPHVLVDDVVRALDVAVSLLAGDRPDAVTEAIRRLIPVDEVRTETAAVTHGVTTIERSGDEEPWLAVVPHDHDGVQATAILTRRGPRFTATEVARCRAVLRLAAQISAGRAGPASPPPAPARRPPTALERLIVLTDGGLVRLRHLGAGDRDELVAHHRRCGFLDGAAGSEVADALVRQDGGDHVAIAALVGTDIVGVGRYAVGPIGREADIVVAVEDRHQGRGIGTLLLTELAELAGNGDVRRLRAVTGPRGEEALARTFRRAGLSVRRRRTGDASVLECGLPRDVPSPA